MQETSYKHLVSIEQRKSITVTAVESVTSFSEVKISLSLVGGEKMFVVGTKLKITSFSKTNGNFTAEGVVSGVSYGGKSFTSRLFR